MRPAETRTLTDQPILLLTVGPCGMEQFGLAEEIQRKCF